MSKQPPLPGLFPGIPWLLLLGPASGVQIRKQQWTFECRIWLNLHVSSWFITFLSLPFLDVPSHFTPIFFIPKPSRLQSVEALGIQLCSPQALLSSTDPFLECSTIIYQKLYLSVYMLFGAFASINVLPFHDPICLVGSCIYWPTRDQWWSKYVKSEFYGNCLQKPNTLRLNL